MVQVHMLIAYFAKTNIQWDANLLSKKVSSKQMWTFF